jgi:hypothetical protein
LSSSVGDVEKLKRRAEEMAGEPLEWFQNGDNAVGFDWTDELIYIISKNHPDGEVIETSSLSINRAWEGKTNY